MELRICTQCGKEKTISEFYFRKDRQQYRKNCIECFKKTHKKRYIKNHSIILKQRKEYVRKNKIIIAKRLKENRQKYPEKRLLCDIKQRCNNPKNHSYKYYGGRGIKCLITAEEIRFLMKRDGYWKIRKPSIDRINNNENYTLENCRFIEQSKNSIKAHSIPILQYDLEGNFIREWESIKNAAEFYNVVPGAINLTLTTRIGKPSAGFIWRYKNNGS